MVLRGMNAKENYKWKICVENNKKETQSLLDGWGEKGMAGRDALNRILLRQELAMMGR